MAKYRKLGKSSSQRKALLRNQVTKSSISRLVTTEARAKKFVK